MALTGFTGAPVHSGSWFGIPDFGITEMLQGKLTTSPSPTGLTGVTGAPAQNQIKSTKAYNVSTSLPGLTTDIQGAYTNNPNNGGGSSEPSVYQANINGQNQIFANRAEYDAAVNNTRNAINSGYDQYFSSLDKQLGLLPEQQKNYEDQVGTQFNSQSGSLKTGQDNTLADLTNVENKTNANKVNSLRDLEDNIRNQIQAGNTYLGARGAGDSSASNMLSFAYTQLGNKQRSGIMRDANQSLADIGLRKNQVVNTYNDQMKQLNEWKSNQILSIAQQINQARQQIEQARASGYVEKGQALAGLNQQLMQNAFAKLQQIDAQAANFQSGLQNWANTHATNLNQYLSMLQGYGNASAPTLATTPLGGINYNSNNNSSDGLTNYSSGQGKRWDPVTQRYV